jgi:hypothetical protein
MLRETVEVRFPISLQQTIEGREHVTPRQYSVPGNSIVTLCAFTRPRPFHRRPLNVVVSDSVACLAVRTYRACDDPFREGDGVFLVAASHYSDDHGSSLLFDADRDAHLAEVKEGALVAECSHCVSSSHLTVSRLYFMTR